MADMFIRNLTHPHRTPDSLPKSATDRCRWRCSACDHEWEQTVLNVVGAGRPCPRCAELMGGAPLSRAARATASGVVPQQERGLRIL
ncbi:zinc-ribbon domain-containing protein [Micromonospora sp. HSS6-12]|uniref:Zinc-ribbon domain-containing protein n=1 Tax=Micromonospora thermarum TaxID=2720024 RepID=A0ABX0ZJ38_9ACTN|nr:zinc-ribbon domain-containing protein [Micromonospora thermarum]